jgi:hypothetical protein
MSTIKRILRLLGYRRAFGGQIVNVRYWGIDSAPMTDDEARDEQHALAFRGVKTW